MQLGEIKGIGKSRISALNNAGIFSTQDLLNHFPKKYYNFSEVVGFNSFGDFCMIRAKITSKAKVIRARKLSFIEVKAQDYVTQNEIKLVWFNQNFLVNVLGEGQEYYFYGKPSKTKKNTFNVSLMVLLDKVKEPLFSVYKTFENIGQATIKSAISYILENDEINSLLPKNVEEKFGLLDKKQAYGFIHNPKTEEEIGRGFDRLNLENALIFAYINEQRKIFGHKNRDFYYKNLDKLFDEFTSLLPWQLTESQINAINEINADLVSDKTLNRMIEGDVGCGKTAVCLWALFACAKNGGQAVLMAPTEILANQHFAFISSVLKGTGLKVALLSSGLDSQEKSRIALGIMTGEIDIVISTNAVLNDGYNFKNLRLCIVDEQHRFGVNARAMLASKGKEVDFISLSATPIPRSISLILYGGLDLTRINARPKAIDIQTNLVSPAKVEDMWGFIGGQIESGRTCYVVCPKIDDSEDESLVSTTKMTKLLGAKFGKDLVCELNGRLKDDKKTKILNDFKEGVIKILVSTTVVEVGVDATRAGVIVIVNPDRFGLATLHQLRGRVSRDGKKSYCFCLVENNISEKALKRLTYFKNNNNGFDIADFDLKTRGAGETFGTRQHGFNDSSVINLTEYSKAQEILNELKNDIVAYDNLKEVSEKTYPQLIKNIILN